MIRFPIICYITDQSGYYCNYHISVLVDSAKVYSHKIAGDMEATAELDFSTQVLTITYSRTGVWGNILFILPKDFYLTEI